MKPSNNLENKTPSHLLNSLASMYEKWGSGSQIKVHYDLFWPSWELQKYYPISD